MNNAAKNKKLRKELKKDWWKYLVAVVLSVVYLLPIYVVLVTSLKTKTDFSSRLVPPTELHFENYVRVFLESGIINAYKNTAIIAVGTIFLIIILGCLAAYPMARCKNRLAKIVRLYVLGVMMIPGICMIVGVYSTLISINAESTYWGMILVLTAFYLPLAIFMYSNFIGGIPVSLDEAAMVDGAGPIQTFFRVILPQLKPVTVSVILIQGIAVWNEFEYALYLLQKPSVYNITLVVKQFFSGMNKELNVAAACAVVAILPILVVYIVLQRYFIEGAMNSAIKG